MIDEVLVHIFTSEWLVLFIVSVRLLVLAETGFRVAQLQHRETPRTTKVR